MNADKNIFLSYTAGRSSLEKQALAMGSVNLGLLERKSISIGCERPIGGKDDSAVINLSSASSEISTSLLSVA